MALLELLQEAQPQLSVFSEIFGSSHYLAAFSVLLLCGIGLPLPEEVTLIYSGILVHQGKADWAAISLVCSAAILLGDSFPYWLGRYWGPRALRIRWVAKVLHPERFALLEQRFERHGNWAVFTCRFLPGLRIPGYFTAGTLRMGYPRFLLLDTLGVLLSVPLSIKLGEIFGGSVETLKDRFQDLHLILAFSIVSLLLILYVRARGSRRTREAAERAREVSLTAEGAEPGPSGADGDLRQGEGQFGEPPAVRPSGPPAGLPAAPATASRRRSSG